MNETSNPAISTCEFHVRYAETDAMGVVHHATYLVYFEEGRSQFLRARGMEYAELEAEGFRLPVTEVGVRYVGGLAYGQKVRLRTWIEENRSREMRFAYEVVDAVSGQSLVTGFTRHIWTDARGRVTSAPAAWRQLPTKSV